MLESTCPEIFSSIPALRLELSPQLAAFGADLARRFEALADRLAHECQAPVPAPEAVQAAWLKPNTYRILAGGGLRAVGTAYPGRLLAVGDLRGLKGIADLDPIRALPAAWIDRRQRPSAERRGALLSEPADLVLRHVERILRQVLNERVAMSRVFHQVARLASRNPNLVQRATRRVGREVLLVSLASLESEAIVCKDLAPLLDRVASAAPLRCTALECIEWLRSRLRSQISSEYVQQGVLECVTLEPELQQWLWCRAWQGRLSLLDPPVRKILACLRAQGRPVTLLVLPYLRPVLSALLRPYLDGLRVLKTDELEPGTQLSVLASLRLGIRRWQIPWLLWRQGKLRRKALREQLEDYAHLSRSSSRPVPRAETPEPEMAVPLRLSGAQTAAVFLLECPTWLLREVLTRLPAREVHRLAQEMSRMGRQSLLYRDQVLESFPGLNADNSDPVAITAHLRRLLTGSVAGPVRELAICLLALGPTYGPVARKVFARLPTETAELVRAEVAELRGQQNQAILPSLNRFAAFYRGERAHLGVLTGPVVKDWLHSAVVRDPAGMARALLTTWLTPTLDAYRHWAAADPSRTARWLLRWWQHGPTGAPEPIGQARAALQCLDAEVAHMLSAYLSQETWEDLTRGPADEDWLSSASLWLASGTRAFSQARN